MIFNKMIYYKYPATWVKIRLFNCEKLFYFERGSGSYYIQTPLLHLLKDRWNLVFGLSFLWWQFSIHFRWQPRAQKPRGIEQDF